MNAWDDLIEIVQIMAVVTLVVSAYIAVFSLLVWGICSLAGWT